MTEDHVLQRLEKRFDSLSRQLQNAARFVIGNPEAIALQSMRSAAQAARVHPNAMLRLAREFGFESYEPFRQQFRQWIIGRKSSTWVERARTLQDHPDDPSLTKLLKEYVEQETLNLTQTFGPEAQTQLAAGVKLLQEARTIYVAASRSLFSIAFYFHYACRMFTPKTVLMSGLGGTFPDDLRNVSAADILLAFSHQPYSRDVVNLVAYAGEAGAKLLVVTDSKVSPFAKMAATTILVTNSSRSLIPTLLPAFAVAEVLASMLVANGGAGAMKEIESSEMQLRRFGAYV
jgi:DNA-binding MurR/RpiR family transcriptional regulator